MKTTKKLLLTFMAMLTAFTVCATSFAACGDEKNSSSQSSQEQSSDSTSDSQGNSSSKPNTSEESSSNGSNTSEDSSSDESNNSGSSDNSSGDSENTTTPPQGDVSIECTTPKGHNFEKRGVCANCNLEVTPKFNVDNMTPIDPAESSSTDADGFPLEGNPYNRYTLSVDNYYEVEIVKNVDGTNEVWIEFGVAEAGQYAVVSTYNPNHVTLTGYDASFAFIGTAYPSRTFDDGNFISTVNCSNSEWSASWKATFALSGNIGDTVRFYIVKIATPAWSPSTITVKQTPTEINGKVAPEGKEGSAPVEVPYESSYFYDETCGYYRMGTATNPGEIIYVALTSVASRSFGESSVATFTTIQLEGSNLSLFIGTTEEGDYLVYDYVPFIMKNPIVDGVEVEYGGSDTSYEAYVNSDGMYPVTQELYQFLNHYAARHTPSSAPEEAYKANAWLAPCYYYKLLQAGSKENPIKITETGTHTVKQYDALSQVYYTFLPATQGTYKITVMTDNVKLWIDDDSTASTTFTVDSDGVTFSFLDLNYEGRDIDIKIEYVGE